MSRLLLPFLFLFCHTMKLIWSLTFLAYFSASLSADRSQIDYLTGQRESYIQFHNFPTCPQILEFFTREDCEKKICNSTANCEEKNQSCCFNGCIFTCLIPVTHSTVFDWLGDLRKIPVAFDQTSDTPEVECSTSSGITNHPCPSGFVCQIMDRGDPLRNIANRGVCVSLDDVTTEGFVPFLDEVVPRSDQASVAKEAVYLPGGCFLTTDQYTDVEEFLKGLHFTQCICSAGSVICSVPRTERDSGRLNFLIED